MESALSCIEIRLQDYFPVFYIRCPQAVRIRRFAVFDPEAGWIDTNQSDTLYYVEEAQVLGLPPDALPRSMVCCSGSCACPDSHNLIRLGRHADPAELAPVLSELLSQLGTHEALMADLLRIMDRTDCVQEMTNHCSCVLHMGIALRDTAFRRIAFSAKSSMPDSYSAMYDRMMEEDFLTEESLHTLRNLNLHLLSDEPFTITDFRNTGDLYPVPAKPRAGIYLPIRSGGHTVAFLTVVSFDRPLDRVDAWMAQDLARLFSLALVREGLVHTQPHSGLSVVLHEIMTEALADDDIIRLRLRALRWDVPENLYAAVLLPEAGHRERNAMRLREIQQTFSDIIHGSICDIWQDTVYLLIGRRQGQPSVSAAQDRLTLSLKANHCVLGISAVFHAPSKLRRYVLQATSAAGISLKTHPENRICFFSDYTVELSVSAVFRDPYLEPEAFLDPRIQALYESPRTADRDLLDTLEQYLFCLKDVQAACEALHIHRSTLFYRLNKLKDLFGEDTLRDGHAVQRLMYSFTVLHRLEEQREA